MTQRMPLQVGMLYLEYKDTSGIGACFPLRHVQCTNTSHKIAVYERIEGSA